MKIRYTSTILLFLVLSVLVVSDNNNSEEATGAELNRNHHRHLAAKGGRGGRTWCVASHPATEEQTKANIKFCCRNPKVDCSAIQKDRKCYKPLITKWHASYAMNQYYQAFGKRKQDCNFGGTGVIVDINPSTRNCTFTG